MNSLKKYFQGIVLAIVVLSQAAWGQTTLESLFKAAEEGNRQAVSFYLDRGLDINSSDALGNTLLMLASRLGHRDLAALLLERKASLTRQNAAGDTALM